MVKDTTAARRSGSASSKASSKAEREAESKAEPDAAPDSAPPRWWHRFTLSERAQRKIGVTAGIVVAVGIVVSIIGQATPWPSAMLIRALFEPGGVTTAAEMEKYVPDTALTSKLNVQYADPAGARSTDKNSADKNSADTTLDAFAPAEGTEALPTVVWVHGGAWVSGHKSDVAPYLRILAAEGYAAIGLDYTVGPEATYPTAVHQLNEALDYLLRHAGEFRIDPNRIVLAGDSAGAQLASQLAALTTNPDYAQLLGIRPALTPNQIVGTILNCGVYDLEAMSRLDGVGAWGFKIALWAYTGTQNWSASYEGTTMSTIDFVTADFPPTWISGGNADALTWIESVPMFQRLKDLGVDTTGLFFAADHEPALGHEYQFHLDGPEAQTALKETLRFLDRVTAKD